ncbi:MAG: hypothetical protein IPL61_01460 [Myxococcales bacterium]|nr:hypothetical protein [Myxococcales bacterium]
MNIRNSLGTIVLAAALAACGGGKKDAPGAGTGGSAGTATPTPTALAAPPLGVDAVKRMNYVYGPGAKDYEKVTAAYKAKARDWAAIKAAAEATLAKDADHLDARWALGEALANTGDAAGATPALAAALAGDWLRWGPGLAQDPDLTGYLATPEGQALAELSGKLRAAVTTIVTTQPLVLARRSGWKSPKPGTGYAATRGELYAYDVASKRYLRVTHTDHSLAGYLRAPSGELLLAGFSQAEVPNPATAPRTAAPLLTRSWVSAWSPTDFTETSAKAAVGKARFVWAGYGPGEQIVVRTAPAVGRWAPGTITTYVVDRSTGKLTKNPGAKPAGPAVLMTLDDVVIEDAGGFPPELPPAVADKLAAAVDVDERGNPRLAAVAWSPGRTRIAFASATDPCATGDSAAKPSIYIGDAATGAYKHVLTADSRFRAQWLDDDRLIYEDGSGGLRLYDAAAGRELAKLGERAGLALATLAPTAAPLCRTEPIVDDPDAVDEPPPDEPAADPAAPVTQP